jgi:phosphoglycerate dehydrogenase-like enzyme
MTTRRDVLAGGVVVGASFSRTLLAAAPGKFRVAVVGNYEGRAEGAEWGRLGSDVEVRFFNQPFESPESTARTLREFDAVAMMRERTPFPRSVIERLPRLKLIIFTGPRNATLDYGATVDRGITVCTAVAPIRPVQGLPVAGGSTPAELSLALMLACAWNLPAADSLIRKGGWAFQPAVPMRGKVLGIAGYGGLGRPMARYGLALGMNVLGWSRSLTDEVARADGITRADRDTLLRDSDVVSIHLPLTKATTGIIGAREIGLMKAGAILINTARAGIVDQAAMLAALRARRIAMAGLDVFDQEPLPRNHPLLRLPNVVMTPHIGYVTEQSLAGMYAATVEGLLAYRRGEPTGIFKPAE